MSRGCGADFGVRRCRIGRYDDNNILDHFYSASLLCVDTKSQQPQTLQQVIRYFSDEQTCIDAVAGLRWLDGEPACPRCGNKTHYWLETQKRWKCRKCARQFSVKQGTVFEDSPLPLDKWLTALWLIVNCKSGISSHEVAKDLGVTQKSAWFMLHRLRLALRSRSLESKFGSEGGRGPAD